MKTPLRWGREELCLRHPDDLDPDAARQTLIDLFEAGDIPPRGHNGELRLDCRAWGGTVEVAGRPFHLVVVRDMAIFTPA